MEARQLEIDESRAGRRLDVLLAIELGLTRGYVRRLLERDLVRVSGRRGVKGLELRIGDRVDIAGFRHPDEGPLACPELPLVMLRREHGLIAVDKPPGLPTHPLDFDEDRSVLNAVLARFPEVRDVGEGGLMSGVVHRLDTQTSGVLVFAEDDGAWQRARAAFAALEVEKRYIARVHGALRGEREVRIGLVHRGPSMRVVASGGREAWTRLRPLRVDGATTLVEAHPRTGLMHQLRATLAHLGHPVVGDRLYGSDATLDRHLLHAESIRIGAFEARSPIPDAFDAPGSG